MEIPIALPLIISGLRSATLQIVSTATIAALVSLGGLGRYVVDGLKLRDFPQMFSGAAAGGPAGHRARPAVRAGRPDHRVQRTAGRLMAGTHPSTWNTTGTRRCHIEILEAPVLRSTFIRTAIAGVAVLGLAACGGGRDPLSGDSDAGGWLRARARSKSITVGSADFSESQLLAEIYGQALAAKGVKVKQQQNIGNRETYMAAIKDGSVHLLPEYTGAALDYFKKGATETEDEAAYKALKAALPPGLEVLDKSPAADEDAIVVTKATADKYQLKSLGRPEGALARRWSRAAVPSSRSARRG